MYSLALVACAVALSHCALAAKGKRLPLSNNQYYPEVWMREAGESNRILKPSENSGQVFWRGTFSESYFLSFSLPFLPLSLPMVRWIAVYESIKRRKTEEILTEVVETRLPACWGHCMCQELTLLHPSAQLPAHLTFPSAEGAAWHTPALLLSSFPPRQGLWALFHVLSPSDCYAFLQHELCVPLFSPHHLSRSLSPCPLQERSLHPPFLPHCSPPVLTLQGMGCSCRQHVKAVLESELPNVTVCLPHWTEKLGKPEKNKFSLKKVIISFQADPTKLI